MESQFRIQSLKAMPAVSARASGTAQTSYRDTGKEKLKQQTKFLVSRSFTLHPEREGVGLFDDFRCPFPQQKIVLLNFQFNLCVA